MPGEQPDWLKSLPIKPLGHGEYQIDDGIITTTFRDVVNAMEHKGPPLENPPVPVRAALLNSLHARFHPNFVDRSPWYPTGDRFHPFRGTIQPLLEHYIWERGAVVASPFTLFIPNQAIAGSADAVITLEDDTAAIMTVVYGEPKPLMKHRVTGMLGGMVAAAIDTRAFNPGHCMVLWASLGQTLVESFSPALCLDRWVQMSDFYKSVRGKPQLKTPLQS